ncbi:hypothetical protein [Aestuariivirga litoralis]|uniref:hypothetical protein n=1 Tax=Aestuariivirga litoralis TaxID=2650924 RepID=UPI0018C82BE6|nr:hypothetical protein [Aestuariivirga litoralis]
MESHSKRIVKLVEDPEVPGHYRVEIWIGDELELVFNFDNKLEAEKRFDQEQQMRGF